MTYEEAVKKTKEGVCMKISITGICGRLSRHIGNVDKGQKYMLQEFGKHFNQARDAWWNNDLETVAQFFKIYV